MARDGSEWETKEDKICTNCGIKKVYDDFSINQYGKNNRILRRPVCIVCYSQKKKLSTAKKNQYEKTNPRPKIGTMFHCPVCNKEKEHKFNNDICLDHDHKTGEIRGYICGSCNASIGKFHEDAETMMRAARWVKGEL